MRLRIQGDYTGRNIQYVGKWTIESSFMTATDGFSFELTSQEDSDLDNLEMQPVTLSLEDRPQVVGRIENTSRSKYQHIACSGRDWMSALTQCDCDPEITVKAGETLESIILRVAGPVGVTKVVAAKDFLAREVRTGKVGVSGKSPVDFRNFEHTDLKPDNKGDFQFLDEIIARHGATLQPTLVRGEVAIAAPDYDQEPTLTLVRKVGGGGNVMASEADRDYSTFPTYILGRGKQAPKGKSAKVFKGDIDVYENRSNYGPEIEAILLPWIAAGRRKSDAAPLEPGKLYRLKTFKDDLSRTPEQNEKAVNRVFAERFRDTLRYKCTVSIADPKQPTPAIDTIVQVADDICRVWERLWVESVTLSSEKTAEMICYRPGSFVL